MNLNDLKIGSELVDDNISSTPAIQVITNTIISREKTVNIPTKSLNINGIAIQDSFDKYLNNEYLSSGMFKEALKTPLHYLFAKNDKSELEKIQGDKPHFELGTFIHQCILEPTKFKRAIIEPKYSLASIEGTKNAIEFWEKTADELNGKDFIHVRNQIKLDTISEMGDYEKLPCKKSYLKTLIEVADIESVTEINYLKIKIIKRNIDNYCDGIIYKLFKHSKREISFYTEIDGLKLRVRPDSIQFEENIGLNAILSVKSSAMEDLRAFYNQAAKMHYDLSEAMYQNVISHVTGREFKTTITLFIQSVPPYGVALLIWDKDDLEVGNYKFEIAKSNIISTELRKEAQGYEVYAELEDMGIIQMKLPEWNNKEFLPQN